METWDTAILVPGTPMQAAVCLARSKGHVVLIDSGWPRTSDQLLRSLSALGIQPGEITHLLQTHLHVDHAANTHLFPNALLGVSRTEYEWADDLYRRLLEAKDDAAFTEEEFPILSESDRRRALTLIQLTRRICQPPFFARWKEYRFFEELSLPKGIRVLPLPGHTPGHSGIVIDGALPVLIAGDALMAEEVSALEMPSVDPVLSRSSAEKAACFRGRIIPGHFAPFCRSGP